MDTISVKELMDGVQVLAVFLGSLLAIFSFFHFALVKPIKSFLQREIVANLVDINKSIQENTTRLEENTTKLDDHIANGGHNHGNSLRCSSMATPG